MDGSRQIFERSLTQQSACTIPPATDTISHKRVCQPGKTRVGYAGSREKRVYPAKLEDLGGLTMTREVIGRVCVAVWLGCIAATAGQLPPEIQVDRYLLRADRLMEAKDPKGALEVMGKIVALQKEHGLTLPEEFHFKHAKVAFSAGEVQEAVDAVHTYLLKAGREGKFYREALELLDEAEQREQLQAWIGDEQTCAGQPKGAECWKELTGQPGCYVWDNYLITDQTVTWTGTCSGGRAQGKGTLKWVWEDGEKTLESTGSLTDGKQHGQWVWRYEDGDVLEGPYVDGKKHGQWVIRLADGGVQEGPFVDGKRHGPWVFRWADGRVEQRTYEDGEEVRRSSRRQTGSAAAGRGRCQVPGYPNPPGGVSNLGFSWCPASVGLQVRSFALQAAGAECAIATGSSSTPEQIEARRREIRAACDRLSALGQGNCQCPAGLGQ